jgi:hypothetical protein
VSYSFSYCATENYKYIESDFYNNRCEIDHEIEYDPCVVSDLFICIKRSQLGERNILDIFTYITFRIGNIRINRLSLEDNLFIAKMLGKKIIACDDIIKIPTPIFDMSMKHKYFGTKFPICLTKNQFTRINLIGIRNDLDISFCYKRYNIIRYHPTENIEISNTELVTYTECREHNIVNNLDHTYNLYFDNANRFYSNSCGLIMIKFEENERISTCVYGKSLNIDQDLNYNQLKQIKLSSDDDKTFIWNDHDNDIITMRHLNMRYYIISFAFGCTFKNYVKHTFYNEYHATNVNFFNGKWKISFEFDNDESVTYNWIYVSIFNKKILQF